MVRVQTLHGAHRFSHHESLNDRVIQIYTRARRFVQRIAVSQWTYQLLVFALTSAFLDKCKRRIRWIDATSRFCRAFANRRYCDTALDRSRGNVRGRWLADRS